MDRYLLRALQEIKALGKCDFFVLQQKFRRNKHLMHKEASVKDYKVTLNTLYNAGNQHFRHII
jgi:hypothetical protein